MSELRLVVKPKAYAESKKTPPTAKMLLEITFPWLYKFYR
jgi:hypothetical protein